MAEPSAWAGADIITTNNYAVVPSCLQLCEDFEGGEEGVRKLVAAAGQAARAACDARPGRAVRVAGCLPPLHESYRPDRVGSFEDNLAHYRLIAWMQCARCARPTGRFGALCGLHRLDYRPASSRQGETRVYMPGCRMCASPLIRAEPGPATV